MPVLVSEMKTGSTYAAEVLSFTLYAKAPRYLKETIWENDRKMLFDSAQNELIKIHHTDYKNFVQSMPENAKVITTVRNPLDTYLSRIHYHAAVANTTFEQALSHFEKEKWLDNTMKRMLSFINSNDPRIAIIAYEKMIATPFQAFADVLNKLSIPFNENTLKNNCEKFSFKSKTGRNIGEEKSGAHERNGSTGQWKNCNIPEILKRKELVNIYENAIQL